MQTKLEQKCAAMLQELHTDMEGGGVMEIEDKQRGEIDLSNSYYTTISVCRHQFLINQQVNNYKKYILRQTTKNAH